MGQAALDLPNPVDPDTGEAGNPDELLSQLAGQEIDRLLAEAEQENSTEELTRAEADSIAAVPTEKEIEQLLAPVNLPAGEDAPPESIPQPQDTQEQEHDAELDEAFRRISVPPMPEYSPEEFSAAAGSSISPPPAIDSESATSAEELAALTTPSEPPPTEREALHADPQADYAPPLVVRLLELVNAPMNLLPDSARDTLGKIAILTLMNAAGVMLYLVCFKK